MQQPLKENELFIVLGVLVCVIGGLFLAGWIIVSIIEKIKQWREKEK